METAAAAKRHERLEIDHNKRLDKVLHVNGYRRVGVPQHGDCFFLSILMHLNWEGGVGDGIQELRDVCKSHLLEHKEAYDPWLNDVDIGMLTSQMITKGSWNHNVMDLMPYMVSNLLQLPVLLFRSTSSNPFEKILPAIKNTNTTPFQPRAGIKHIPLAYNVGTTHYDGAVQIKGTIIS